MRVEYLRVGNMKVSICDGRRRIRDEGRAIKSRIRGFSNGTSGILVKKFRRVSLLLRKEEGQFRK